MMDEIWEQFSAKLRKDLREIVDEADVDDLLQELFTKVLSDIDQLSQVRNLGAWLKTSARHLAIDHLRKLQRTKHVSLDQDVANPQLEESIYTALTGCLNTALTRLPKKYQHVMHLLVQEEKSQVDIAKELGLSIPGAKSRVQRGRKLLKKELERCCQFHFDSSGQLIDFAPSPNQSCAC